MHKVTRKPIVLMMAILGVILVAATIACSGNQETATATAEPATSKVETSPSTTGVANAASVSKSDSSTDAQKIVSTSPVLAPESKAAQAAQAVQATVEGSGQAGIWVNGIGSKDVDADVAVLSIGVESRETSVAAARAAAATAMNDVLDALKVLGVAEDDIVTTSLNIYPNQVWIEVKDDAGTHNEPRIVGYVVNNEVRVTVRDIEMADEAIDKAAEVGGDLIRINNVWFTVGDPAAHADDIRRRAVEDAKAKAKTYAEAFGVKLGPLAFLQELSGSGGVIQDSFGLEVAMARSAAASTPIESGNVSLSTTIQVGFSILP